MKLTERQQNMIRAFLQQVDREASDLPANQRAQTLTTVKARVELELESGDATLEDEQVAAALRRCRVPSRTPAKEQAGPSRPARARQPSLKKNARGRPITTNTTKTPKPKPGPGTIHSRQPERHRPSGLASEDRRWLGVCLDVAQRLSIEPFVLRLGFVLLGIVTGPVALIVYLGIYFGLYLFSKDRDRPFVNGLKLLKTLVGTVATALALYGATRGLMALGLVFYERFMGKAPILEQWNWLEISQNTFLFCTLFLLTPIAILSALPVPNAWDYTGKKIVQAGLAVYAVLLSLGIASFVVGIILLLVEEIAF